MIEILKNFPDNVIALSCEGQVTKEDYRRDSCSGHSRSAQAARQDPAFL